MITHALKELKGVLVAVTIFDVLFNTIAIFLFFYLLLMLITVNPMYSLAPTALYFAVFFPRAYKKKVNLEEVENKVPILNEQLRTSADNISKPYPIVQSLHEDVLRKMRHVNTSAFINFNKTGYRLLLVALLSFGIISLAAADVKFIDFNKVVSDVKRMTSQTPSIFSDVDPGAGEETDIYGEESIAELGTNELNLEINPMASEIDINDIQDVQKREFISTFPEEIAAKSDSSYDDNIPKEHKEIVKRYFREIAK